VPPTYLLFVNSSIATFKFETALVFALPGLEGTATVEYPKRER
jgi:hypothetical protein